MSVVYLLVPAALALVGAAILAFVWAARRGQFDDLETPALRAVHEDGDEPPKSPVAAQEVTGSRGQEPPGLD